MARCTFRRRLLLYSLLGLIPFSCASSYRASYFGHRERYPAYEYDLATPQYSPDGRLLQVEYASNACKKTFPIVVVGVAIPSTELIKHSKEQSRQHITSVRTDDSNAKKLKRSGWEGAERSEWTKGGSAVDTFDEEADTVLIMATVSLTPHSSTLESAQHADDASSHNDYSNERAQFRIVDIPLSSSSIVSNFKYGASSDVIGGPRGSDTTTLLVGMSGVLSDATSLLKVIQTQLENEQGSFGWHRLHIFPSNVSSLSVQYREETVDLISTSSSFSKAIDLDRVTSHPVFAQPSETVTRASRAIAEQCQRNAFGGGIRPFGANLVLAGVDRHDSSIQKAGRASRPSRGEHKMIKPTTLEDDKRWHKQDGARISVCETDPSGGWRSNVKLMKTCSFYRSRTNDSTEGQKVDVSAEQISITSPLVMTSGGPTKFQAELQLGLERELKQLYVATFSGMVPQSVNNSTSNTTHEFTTVDADITEKLHWDTTTQHHLSDEEDEIRSHETIFTQEVLRTVLKLLVDEWYRNYAGGLRKPTEPRIRNNSLAGETNSTPRVDDNDASRKKVSRPKIPRMEVVFVSSKHGVFRLNEIDIERLLKNVEIK